ncbi:MAG TPA: hypothetical protein VIL84_11095 [Devosiaceae bacterium]
MIKTLARSLMCVGLMAASGATSAQATGGPSALGVWQPDSGEARYEFAMCGDNGDRLCGTLIWVRPDKDTPDQVKELKQYQFSGLRSTGAGEWKGPVSYRGINGEGTLKVLDEKEVFLKACAFFLCKTIKLNRYDGTDIGAAQ